MGGLSRIAGRRAQPPPGSFDTPPGNRCGRTTAITVVTAVAPWWSWALRLQFALRPHLPRRVTDWLARELVGLSFIHFARWTLIRGLPRERLRSDLLLFESNFNGDWERYIDAFSYVIPGRMRLLWQGAYGFPGPVPAGPFKVYIREHEHVAQHFWSAYPEATTTSVLDALALGRRLDALARDARLESAETFAAHFARMLVEEQHRL